MLGTYQAKAKDASNYNTKMYVEVSRQYSNYIKVYVTVSNKTDILSKGMKNISDDVRTLSTS